MEILEVSPDTVGRIAKKVFGPEAVVGSIREIRPTTDHGIQRIMGCNANLSFIVEIAGDPRKYVFRFSRGYREERFEREARSYALIGEKTDIPTPKVYAVDRTKTVAPTPYMVLEWMPGDIWKFLTHPANPMTNSEEKDEIARQTGGCYAQIHNIERKASSSRQGMEMLLYRLEQLVHVVQDGQFAVEMTKLDRCRQIIENDSSLLMQKESVCVNDAELHFVKANGGWEPSFICDMEWVDFGDPYLDLAVICPPRDFWELESLFALEDGHSVASRPFFKGYGEHRFIDYDRLGRFAAYAHFSVMCSITGQVYRADKRAFMKSLEPKYAAIVDGILEMVGR
jgi:aminoglycoside phosphotransferase (APT) family kinase protein